MSELPTSGASQGDPLRVPTGLEGSFLAHQPRPREAPALPPASPPAATRRGLGTRVILPLCLFVVLVAGIAWVSQYLPSWTKKTSSTPPPPQAPLRTTAVTTAEENPRTGYTREFERDTEGHIDYLLFNPGAEAVELGVSWQQCTCSRLEACGLTTAEAEPLLALDKELQQAGAKEAVQVAKLKEARRSLEQLATRLGDRMQPMVKEEDHGIQVPGGRAVVLRLVWRPKHESRFKLSATLWMLPDGMAGKARVYQDLVARVALVPAVRLHPEIIKVGRLFPGRPVTEEFLFWSATRDNLDVKLAGDTNPCLVCTVKRLGPTELPEAQRQLEGAGFPTHVRAACKLTATVYVEKDGRQLDMGLLILPIRVQVKADGEALDVTDPSLRGLVQSDVRLVNADPTDDINLGSFKARDGTSKTVALSSRPRANLKLADRQPAFLQLKLTKKEMGDTETTWDLEVTVPPQAYEGELPLDTAVVLETSSPNSPARRVRIHVVGTAARD